MREETKDGDGIDLVEVRRRVQAAYDAQGPYADSRKVHEEFTRLVDFTDGDVTCRGCGRTIHLYWNGGELDEAECCGFFYRTEHVRTDLVIEVAPRRYRKLGSANLP